MNIDRYHKTLEKLASKNQLRNLPITDKQEGVNILFNNKEYLNFSSNDYLGLASDKYLQKTFFEYLNSQNSKFNSHLLSASSSRLLTGNSANYSLLEQTLENLYQRPTLIFNSGYHANIGILPALSTKNDLILSDKLNHASLVDGCRLSLAKTLRYRHLDYEQIEEILEKTRQNYEQVFLVSESVFSMDGDCADLEKLCYLKEKYSLILYIDEAHSLGTFGKKGLGVSEETDTLKQIDILVGTFGKAIASQGAFAVCNTTLKDYLINTCRSLIFTTGLPPIILSWINFVFTHLPEWEKLRIHLKKISEYARNQFTNIGFSIPSNSNIIPLITGKNELAEKMATFLQKKGFLVLPIRPPSVPENTARLRLSLTANMTFEQLDSLIDAVRNFKENK